MDHRELKALVMRRLSQQAGRPSDWTSAEVARMLDLLAAETYAAKVADLDDLHDVMIECLAEIERRPRQ